jgi:murein L,D-transpeptidase YcbB/YkuD
VGNFSDQRSNRFDSSEVRNFLAAFPEFHSVGNEIEKFYRQRAYAYAWYEAGVLIEQATGLFNRILQIEEEGIYRSFPYRERFKSIMDEADSVFQLSPANPTVELMLTAQYLTFAQLVWQGMGPDALRETEWYLPRKKLSASQLMEALLSERSIITQDTMAVYSQYEMLKNYLRKYRAIERGGGFPHINNAERPYRKGDTAAAIRSIREYLYLTGDLSNDTPSNVFDDGLESAVKKFQLRHGRYPDGVAGTNTLFEMTVPIKERILQILVNMERCRWIPLDMKGDYLFVNIPAFSLNIFANDSVIKSMRVVVGKKMNKTAIFTGKVNAIVFNPYWYVPPGIYRKEILPEIAKDSAYLKKNHMEWSGNTLRQKPGPDNPLGRIKFVFPNSFNIYLHDTPGKQLFEKEQRDFSHGCIRIEDPLWLCKYLLKEDSSWNNGKIEKIISKGKEHFVPLKKSLPVYISYFTAWVDRTGKLQFRKDIYKKDPVLAAMLIGEK